MVADENARDLAALVVPSVGSLLEIGSRWEPYRLVDPAGDEVASVTAYFRDLQAAGRSAATVRSYGMDLLRGLAFFQRMPLDAASRLDPDSNCPPQSRVGLI